MSDNTAMVPVEQLVQLAASNQATAEELGGMIQQMGVYLIQLDARMRKQEELLQHKVTVSHSQQKQLMAAIRKRGGEICGKYSLATSVASDVRKAIKKDLLARWRVKDLHDLPESCLGDALAAAGQWDSYSTVRKIRERTENV